MKLIESIKNRVTSFVGSCLSIVAAVLTVSFGLAATAHATVPAEITTALADAESVWTSVKALIILIGLFLILWAFFRKGIRKAG